MTAEPDNWMPLYIGDYLRDTMHLTTEQHGAYLLLLMAGWTQGGSLPDDDVRLAAIVRLPVKEWRKLRPVLAEFYRIANGLWVQGRLQRERTAATEQRDRIRSARRHAAQQRWQSNRNANALQTPCSIPPPIELSNESSSPLSPPARPDAKPKRAHRLPADWVLPDEWRSWAQAERPGIDAGRVAEDFRDYWHAKAGAQATKADWFATWRIWVRRQEDGRNRGHAGRASSSGILAEIGSVAADRLAAEARSRPPDDGF